jgi:anti-anti-sigma factor
LLSGLTAGCCSWQLMQTKAQLRLCLSLAALLRESCPGLAALSRNPRLSMKRTDEASQIEKESTLMTTLEDGKMATPAYCFTTLKIDMDEKPEEITICCNGRITAESAYMFEREVRDNAIPVSRGKGVAVINRIILDLSNVTHIDNAGLEALLSVWTAGQRKACNVEVINRGPSAGKLLTMARLDHLLTKVRALFG